METATVPSYRIFDSYVFMEWQGGHAREFHLHRDLTHRGYFDTSQDFALIPRYILI